MISCFSAIPYRRPCRARSAGDRVVSSVPDRRAVRDTVDRTGALAAFVPAARPTAGAAGTLAGADATAFVARTLAGAGATTFALVGRAACCHNCTDRSVIPNLAAAAAAP
jgi:hypothetical protein